MKNQFSQIWAVLAIYKAIKIFLAILSKSRIMIINCQINSRLENCFKTDIVGFKWVLGFSWKKNKPRKMWNSVLRQMSMSKGYTKSLSCMPLFQLNLDLYIWRDATLINDRANTSLLTKDHFHVWYAKIKNLIYTYRNWLRN